VWRLMVLFLLLLPAGFAGAESPPSDLEAPALAQLLERNAPAVVTVRARLRSLVRFGGDQQENEQAVEARGVMVSPRGLVLLSNSYLSATRLVELYRSMGAPEDFTAQTIPAELRVVVAGSDRELPAVLVASDADLDLAFVQLDPVPEEPFSAVDFTSAGPLTVGRPIAVVSRLGSSFDAAPYLETARLAGRITRPREAWLLDGPLTAVGLPAFGFDGRPLGILTTVLSPSGSTLGQKEGYEPLAIGLPQRRENQPIGLFLVPAARVRVAIDAALARVAERARTTDAATNGEMPSEADRNRDAGGS